MSENTLDYEPRKVSPPSVVSPLLIAGFRMIGSAIVMVAGAITLAAGAITEANALAGLRPLSKEWGGLILAVGGVLFVIDYARSVFGHATHRRGRSLD